LTNQVYKEDIFRGIKSFCFVVKIMFHAFSLAQSSLIG